MDEAAKDISVGRQMLEKLSEIAQHLAILRSQVHNPPREWLTIGETARELQLSIDTIQRLIHSGKLKAARLETEKVQGRRCRYRIHREWIIELMNSLVSQKVPELRPLKSNRPNRSVDKMDFIR
jgi:excisionase family DNA binding protein